MKPNALGNRTIIYPHCYEGAFGNNKTIWLVITVGKNGQWRSCTNCFTKEDARLEKAKITRWAAKRAKEYAKARRKRKGSRG